MARRFSANSILTSVTDSVIAPCTSGSSDYKIQASQMQMTPVGTCSTVAATAAKAVTVSTGFGDFSDTSYILGRHVMVTFTYANSVANPTLTVGSVGPYSITCRGVAVEANAWAAGAILEFVLTKNSAGTLVWECVSLSTSSYSSTSNVPVNGIALNSALAKYSYGIGSTGSSITFSIIGGATQAALVDLTAVYTIVNHCTFIVRAWGTDYYKWSLSDSGSVMDTLSFEYSEANTMTISTTLTGNIHWHAIVF